MNKDLKSTGRYTKENEELDAIEDYFTVELTDEQKIEYRSIILDLWAKLCKAYDKDDYNPTLLNPLNPTDENKKNWNKLINETLR